jgi:hypothetical protein
VLKRGFNPWLMVVLGIEDVGAGVLVVSGGAEDDDAALLSCLERVSYVKVIYLFMFNFLFSRCYT